MDADTSAGLVVAGGYSTRFGEREKAVIDLCGTPLIRRVVDRLSLVVDEIVVNCRSDQREQIAEALSGVDVRFAIDDVPDRGPLGGIATGLSVVDAEYTAVVSCDLPFLEPAIVELLFEEAAGHDAAVPRPGEWFEPLHAVYRSVPMRVACESTLESDDGRVIAPLEDLDYVVVDREPLLARGSLDSFESVDDPDALAWAEQQIGG
ncbi:MAG: molybdenum cofactor guanylyltransferase [Natronomonas sp.]